MRTLSSAGGENLLALVAAQ